MVADGGEGTVWLLVATGIAAALLVGLVLLRSLTDGRAEVKVTDAVIALLPVVIALFATGKITKLVVGPEGVTVERAREAILGAATSAVTDQVDAIDRIKPEELEVAAKGGVGRIAEYVARGIQALTYQVGARYVPEIMEQYFHRLTQSPRFRYMILVDGDRFFGMMEAGKLVAFVDEEAARRGDAPGWADIRHWIENDPDRFSTLAGFVSADHALPSGATKRQALQRLEDEDRDWLPVTDGQGSLIGIVDRSRLTASLILDVAGRLEGEPAGTP